MQILFKGSHIKIYRNGGQFYLKNGSTHKITQGQGNVLISRLHGLTDEQAESLITSEYEQGKIKTVRDRTKQDESVHSWLRVAMYIAQKYYNGEPKNYFTVKLRINKKTITKSFRTLEESAKYRDETLGYTVEEPPLYFKQTKKRIEPLIDCITRSWGSVYMVKCALKTNGVTKNYHKTFKNLDDARAYRNEIKMFRQSLPQ